jgi:outer membrane protein
MNAASASRWLRRLGLLVLACGLAEAAPPKDTSEPLSLEQCIELAWARSPDLAEVEADVETARSDLARAKAGGLATVELRQIFGAVNEARGDVFFSPDSRTDLLNGLGPFSQLDLEIIQPLFTFGRISAGRRAARHGLEARLAGVSSRRDEIAYQVKERHGSVLLTGEILKVLSEVRDELDQAEQRIRKRLDEIREQEEESLEPGAAASGAKAAKDEPTRADLLRLELALAELRRRVRELEAGREEALDGLKNALGLPLEEPLRLRDTQLRPVGFELGALDRYVELSRSRGSYRQSVEGALSLEAALESARKESWPVFFVTGVVRWAVAPNRDKQTNPFVYDPWNTFDPGAVFGLRWNLAPWAVSPEVARARAELHKVLAQRRQAELGVPVEVKKAWLEVRRAKADLEDADKARRAARALLVLGQTDLFGTVEGESRFEALQKHIEATVAYDQAVHTFNLAVAELSRVTGTELVAGSGSAGSGAPPAESGGDEQPGRRSGP